MGKKKDLSRKGNVCLSCFVKRHFLWNGAKVFEKVKNSTMESYCLKCNSGYFGFKCTTENSLGINVEVLLSQ